MKSYIETKPLSFNPKKSNVSTVVAFKLNIHVKCISHITFGMYNGINVTNKLSKDK